MEEDMAGPVELIETKRRMAMVIAKSVPDKPGIAGELFSQLGKAGFNIEMISESSISGGSAEISFALNESQVKEAVAHLKGLEVLKSSEFVIEKGRGILTVYGKNLAHEPGIAGKIFSILAQEAINIDMIGTSFTAISVLIKDSYLTPARNLLSRELGLDA
jgi:aspartate kinase